MTARRFGRIPSVVTSLIILALGMSLAVAAEKIPRLTKEELKELLGRPGVIILDVRTTLDWKKSDQKILGAVREDPDKAVKTWAEKYQKDKTMVLYCA